MTQVTLHKVTRTLTKWTRSNWILRWYGTDGKRYSETIGLCLRMTKRDAEYAQRKKQADLDSGVIQPNKPTRVTLDQFLAEYPERRRQGDAGRGHHRGAPRLSGATITDHTMTIRYMVHHFGGGRALDSISIPDADVFVDALAGGQLDAARKTSKRKFGMSSHTVRGHIRNVKAVFNWARLMGMVTANPFADFTGAPLPSKANHYVPLPDFERLLAAAPTHGWKVLYALCRLAGLRRGEALSLPWSGRAVDTAGEEHLVGVDWDGRRLGLVGNHKGRNPLKYRQVPVCPRLHSILLAAFDAAEPGTVTATGLSPNNLTKRVKEHLAAAGLTPWPKVYQAMRSSCENDWKVQHVAEPTYAAWCGHSPAVSRKHYVAPTDAEFAAASK